MSLDKLAFLVGALCVLIMIAALVAVLLRTRSSSGPIEPRPVMTQAELAFYRRLTPVLERIGGVDVFAQVSMGAIMEVSRSMEQSQRRALRNRFDRKVVDFVVTDEQSNVLLLIELDDRTHDADRDGARDQMTRSAGYPTLRIRGRAARDGAEIERLVRTHLSSRPS